MSEKALQPIEQKTVTFYDDELIAILAEDGKVYVSINQMCNALGLNQRSQRRRVQDHQVLSDGCVRGDISAPPSSSGRGGGRQTALLLRVDLVPLWLAGINVGKASEMVRGKLLRFQREAADVLWNAFQSGELTTSSVSVEEQTPAERALATAKAIYELAQNQVLIERRLDSAEQRIEALEANAGNLNTITDDQAQQVSEAVKLIASILSDRSGRNEYGGVYGELYRRFGVTSYKLLPTSKFDQAISFLRGWYQQLTDTTDTPF